MKRTAAVLLQMLITKESFSLFSSTEQDMDARSEHQVLL